MSVKTTQDKKTFYKPFIKWVGGKRQLLNKLRELYPEYLEEHYPRFFNRYFEPFVGGGAVFFDLKNIYPNGFTAYLFDNNDELINTYNVIKNKVDLLINELGKYKYDKEFYLQVRALDRRSDFKKINPIKRAARFIYLNRTCFNGLWRVNSKDQFNVPFGKYTNPLICDESNLKLANDALKHVFIKKTDFTEVLNQAEKGDFIYFDPPYDPIDKTSNFTSYTIGGFGKDEQIRLFETFRELDKKGCFVMLSNHNTDFINKLYAGYNKHIVQAKRSINSNANKRGKIQEIVILNYSQK